MNRIIILLFQPNRKEDKPSKKVERISLKKVLAFVKDIPAKVKFYFATRKVLAYTWGVIQDQFKRFLATMIFICLVVLIGQHDIFVEYTNATYNFIQSHMAANSDKEKVPNILIIDISELKKVDGVTPRNELKSLIRNVMNWNPRSVGVDIDFSPPEDYRDHLANVVDDIKFFKFCAEYNRVKPQLFLGIGRSLYKAKDKWLLEKDYSNLAASLYIPKGARAMLSRISFDSKDYCPSLSSALVGSHENISKSRLYLAKSIVNDKIKSDEEPNRLLFSLDRFLIDYSTLEYIKGKCVVNFKDVSDTWRPNIKDMGLKDLKDLIVLIGDAKTIVGQDDYFLVPGRGEEGVPGVFVHACAVYTLLNKPLYDISEINNVKLDLAVAAIIALVIAIIKIGYFITKASDPPPSDECFESTSLMFEYFILISILIFGVFYVSWSRIAWYGFPLLLFARMSYPAYLKITRWIFSSNESISTKVN